MLILASQVLVLLNKDTKNSSGRLRSWMGDVNVRDVDLNEAFRSGSIKAIVALVKLGASHSTLSQ